MLGNKSVALESVPFNIVGPPLYSNSNIINEIDNMIGLTEAQRSFYLAVMRYFDGDEIEVNRQTRYNEFWELYRGEHWKESEKEEDVPTPVYNKLKAIINKGVSFLVGKPFTVHYVNSDIENLLSPYVKYIIDKSGGELVFGLEAAQMGFVTGDVFLKPVYDKQRGIYIQICDSKDACVKYYYINYNNTLPDVAQIKYYYTDPADGNKKKEYREIWTPEYKAVFIDKKYIVEKSSENLLKKVPVVHIRNQICGKTIYGFSDIADMESLNLLLNYGLRRFMNMVDYNADPITVLFGARITELEKGDNKLWGNLPKDARVQNLEQSTDFPSLQKFIEYISTAIHEVASVTENSVQGMRHVSNTSGTAMYMNNLPLIELTDRKRALYSQGLEQAIKIALDLILIAVEKNEVLNVADEELPPDLKNVKEQIKKILAGQKKNEDKIKPWNWLRVRFQDYMPKDRLTEMQMIKDEMSLGLESRYGACQRLGKENIDEILARVEEDLEFYAKQEAISSFGGAPSIKKVSGDSTEGMSVGTKLDKSEQKGDIVSDEGDD